MMKWVIIDNSGEQIIYGRLDDDGLIRVTCIAEHPEYQAWVEEGNTAKTYKPAKTTTE
jgi:hypothetical protein